MIIWWLLFAIALLGSAIPISNSLSDRLIRREYHLHRDAWEQDGRPIGPFFAPEEAKPFTSRLAFHFAALGWLLSTPQWIRDDVDSARLLRRFRWTMFVLCIAVFLLFYLIWRLVTTSTGA
jgi:hypothetical protein